MIWIFEVQHYCNWRSEWKRVKLFHKKGMADRYCDTVQAINRNESYRIEKVLLVLDLDAPNNDKHNRL